MTSNLHVYLVSLPPLKEVASFLGVLGYAWERTATSDDPVEPDCHYWSWSQPPLSKGGIELLYFDGAFTDNVRYGEYGASVVLRGVLDGSEVDMAMVDITASLLLSRYGGVLHNPQRLDRKFPNLFLCGVNNPRGKS